MIQGHLPLQVRLCRGQNVAGGGGDVHCWETMGPGRRARKGVSSVKVVTTEF